VGRTWNKDYHTCTAPHCIINLCILPYFHNCVWDSPCLIELVFIMWCQVSPFNRCKGLCLCSDLRSKCSPRSAFGYMMKGELTFVHHGSEPL
jgi:hypothetical protein